MDCCPFHQTPFAARPCPANRRTYFVGGLCRDRHRRQCCGLRVGAIACGAGAGFMGAGPCLGQGKRVELPAGHARHGLAASGREPACRCAMGHGRRVALRRVAGCDWRDLGRPACAEFYRHQKACHAGGGGWGAVLVDAPRGGDEFKRGPRPLAGGGVALCAAAFRCPSPGRATVAGGIVPVAQGQAGCLGGGP